MAWKKGAVWQAQPLGVFWGLDRRQEFRNDVLNWVMDVEKTQRYARRLEQVLTSGLDQDALARALAEFDDLFVNGRLVHAKEVAEMVWGLPGDPDYHWTDARPDLSLPEKKSLVLENIRLFAEGGDQELTRLFYAQTAYIRFRGARIRVERVLQDDGGFILYRALDEEAYYLDVMKNMSFAYYSECYRLSKPQGEAFLAKPSYEAALGNPGEPER